MKHDVFWAMIEAARKAGKNDQEAMCEALAEALGELEAKEIAGFDTVLRELRNAAYRWDLWGAAYLMAGGCSDDGFEYFRNWLIATGKKTYEAALADPDSLASVPMGLSDDGICEFESLWYVAPDVYEQVAGKAIPRNVKQPKEPAGAEFDFEDEGEMRRRYPKLARKFVAE
jgi:hypothetical protein